MTRILLSTFTLFFLFLSENMRAQEMTIATFNVRYENRTDTGNLWKDRAKYVVDLIRFHDFDIFGTQEALLSQLNDISEALPGYSRYGIGRDDGKEKGEFTAIFYKKDKFTLLNKGDFWLSETPEKPSLGWDGTCCNRICSWVYLEEKESKKKFYFFNTHFDHQGIVARKESSKLVLQRMKSIAGSNPVILVGDLNGDQNSEWYETLAESELIRDTFEMADFPYANNGSFNGFGQTLHQKNIIDHVFVTPHFSVSKWGILTDSYHGKYPSDHFPILVKVNLK